MNDTQKNILEKLLRIVRWTRDERVATHKPLLVLFALSKIKDRYLSYNKIHNELTRLLKIYGENPHSHKGVNYPFWRLRNDGIWKIENDSLFIPNNQGDVSHPDLLSKNAIAGFMDTYYDAFNKSIFFRYICILRLLELAFPKNLHIKIIKDLGFSLFFYKFCKFFNNFINYSKIDKSKGRSNA